MPRRDGYLYNLRHHCPHDSPPPPPPICSRLHHHHRRRHLSSRAAAFVLRCGCAARAVPIHGGMCCTRYRLLLWTCVGRAGGRADAAAPSPWPLASRRSLAGRRSGLWRCFCADYGLTRVSAWLLLSCHHPIAKMACISCITRVFGGLEGAMHCPSSALHVGGMLGFVYGTGRDITSPPPTKGPSSDIAATSLLSSNTSVITPGRRRVWGAGARGPRDTGGTTLSRRSECKAVNRYIYIH
jgi:hypothetical protein